MTAEAEIVARDREELIALLTEAAEIEHGLMCCYLYAAFSLKTTDDSGLSATELEATRRWRAAIMDVAIEEMLHLGLVANLMTAIGAQPHFSRPNFPVEPGMHPSGVVVRLMRFSKPAIDHFVYLERPEGVEIADGAGFESPRAYQRAVRPQGLLPSSQDFETVGHLYRGIRGGFAKLAAELGEKALFLGSASAQMNAALSGFDKLIPATDLASAETAIETIVEQGEGAPGHKDDSHYVRFCAVRDEFAALVAADPSFDPAWPAALNPVMRTPPTPEGKVHVASVEAQALLDVANSAYGLMLRCLMAAFGDTGATQAQRRALYDAAIDVMHAVAPLAERLARTPASDHAPTPTAGMTFTLPRSIAGVHRAETALKIAAERAAELAEASKTSLAKSQEIRNAAPTFARIARALGEAAGGEPQAATPAPSPAAEVEAASLSVDEAIGKAVAIRFDAKRCIHSRFCVLQAPSVFKANTPGQWIFPDEMDAERLVAVAEMCPSGAITYMRRDGKAPEPAPAVNVAKIRENGPYAIQADIDLAGEALLRVTLCRCGASKNKPFCDGSHNAIQFTATGEPATRKSEPLSPRGGKLKITPTANGPLALSGPLEICAGTGRTVDRVTTARLCRCGGSANKPYCDGTHARIGFRSG